MADTRLSNPKDSIGDRKVPMWLLSGIAKAHWSIAQFAGMLKYGAWNWRIAGVRFSVYLSAMERHIEALKNGEEFDPVDGTRHEGNLMACAALLLDARAAGKLIDDRPPSVSVRPAFAEVEAQMERLREQYKDRSPRHYTIADTLTNGAQHDPAAKLKGVYAEMGQTPPKELIEGRTEGTVT